MRRREIRINVAGVDGDIVGGGFGDNVFHQTIEELSAVLDGHLGVGRELLHHQCRSNKNQNSTDLAESIEDLVEVYKDLPFADFSSVYTSALPAVPLQDIHIVQALASMVPYPALRILEARQDRRDDDPKKRRNVLSERDGCCCQSDEACLTPFNFHWR